MGIYVHYDPAVGIEIRTHEEVERGLVEADIISAAYPPGDPRRYSQEGLEKYSAHLNEVSPKP